MFFRASLLVTLACVFGEVASAPKTVGQIQMGIARATNGIFLVQNGMAEMNRNSARAEAVYANIMSITSDLYAVEHDCKANDMLIKDQGEETMISVVQLLEPLATFMRDIAAKVSDFNGTTIQGDNARRIVSIAITQLCQQCDATWGALESKLSDNGQKAQLSTLRSAIQLPMGATLQAFH